MNHSVRVGKTEIPYTIRESLKASNLSIHVRPESVEVVVPKGSLEQDIHQRVLKRANWIYTKQDLLKELAHKQNDSMPQHFRTGSKVLYRGRRVMLHISKADITFIDISYSNGLFVSVPGSLQESSWDGIIHLAISDWMKQQVLKDVKQFTRKYSKKLNLFPKDVRVKDQKHLWGSLGKDEIVNINWTLIFAPRKVLEYVVAHEICHLKYRNHSEEYWRLLGSVFSELDECRKWLGEEFV